MGNGKKGYWVNAYYRFLTDQCKILVFLACGSRFCPHTVFVFAKLVHTAGTVGDYEYDFRVVVPKRGSGPPGELQDTDRGS